MNQAIKDCKEKIQKDVVNAFKSDDDKLREQYWEKIGGPSRRYVEACNNFIEQNQEFQQTKNNLEAIDKKCTNYAQLLILIFDSLLSYCFFDNVFNIVLGSRNDLVIVGTILAILVVGLAFFLVPFGVIKSILIISNSEYQKRTQEYQQIKKKRIDHLDKAPLLLNNAVMDRLKIIHNIIEKDNILYKEFKHHAEQQLGKQKTESIMDKEFQTLSNKQLYEFFKIFNTMELDNAYGKIMLERFEHGFEKNEG